MTSCSLSSGFAFTLGRLDGDTTLDEVIEHTRILDRATSLPVSGDFSALDASVELEEWLGG